MADTPESPLINGNYYSFASLEAKVNGTPRPLTSLDYSDKLEPGEARTSGSPEVKGRTLGKYSTSASFEGYKQDVDAIVADLGAGYGTKPFPIFAQYADDGQPVTTDEIQGCRITEIGTSFQEGSDPLKVKVTLSVMRIYRNGLLMIPVKTGA